MGRIVVGFAVLQTVGDQAQCQRLDGRGGLLLGAAVRRHAWERRNIGQPAPVLFPVVLDGSENPSAARGFGMSL